MSTPGEITPATHFKAPLAIIVTIVGAIAAASGAGVGAWAALNGKLDTHLADKDRHLDPDWQKDHGRPIGRFDLDSYKAEMKRQLDEMAASQGRTENMVRDFTLPARLRKQQRPTP